MNTDGYNKVVFCVVSVSQFIPGVVHLEDKRLEDAGGQDNISSAAVLDIAAESAKYYMASFRGLSLRV